MFDLLSPSRPAGFGAIQPIPLSEMAALRQMMVLPCSVDEFISITREMDWAYMEIRGAS